MKQNKVQTVQNFLTPSKLLSSKMRTSNKPKHTHAPNTSALKPADPVDPVANPNNTWASPETPRRERQSYKKQKAPHVDNVSEADYRNTEFQLHSSRDDLVSSKHASSKNSGVRYGNGKQKVEDQNFILADSKESPRDVDFSESRISNGDTEGVASDIKRRPIEHFTRSEALGRAKTDNDRISDSKRNYIVPIKKNPEISQLQIKDLMHKLMAVRNQLEDQIAELKHLLDNTSSYLEHIDQQYEKIKQKILFFTSRALDASFNEYKSKLPDWNVYVNVETNGLNKLTEINELLESYEDMGGDSKNNRINSNEIQRKIDGYKLLSQEIKDARGECLSKRPQLSEQRIKKFEACVWELGKF